LSKQTEQKPKGLLIWLEESLKDVSVENTTSPFEEIQENEMPRGTLQNVRLQKVYLLLLCLRQKYYETVFPRIPLNKTTKTKLETIRRRLDLLEAIFYGSMEEMFPPILENATYDIRRKWKVVEFVKQECPCNSGSILMMGPEEIGMRLIIGTKVPD
jgi:hypothetical protein